MKEYTDEAKQFYKTRTWERCRKSYLQSVGGLCERCLSSGAIVPAKIVHHKQYINAENINNPDITLNYKNLEALCQDCHNKEHIKHKRRYQITEGGELILTD